MNYSVLDPHKKEIWHFFLSKRLRNNNVKVLPSRRSLGETIGNLDPRETEQMQRDKDEIFITDSVLGINMVWEFLGNNRVKITAIIQPENVIEINDE